MTDPSRPETPEETLARLQANTASAAVSSGSGDRAGAGAGADGGPRFSRRRIGAGYDIEAVDRFVATIDRRSADEIKEVTFPYRRFGGYDVREVDDYLEDEIDRRRST